MFSSSKSVASCLHRHPGVQSSVLCSGLVMPHPRKKQKLRVQLRCASEKGRETKTSDEKSHKSHHKTEIWKPQKLVFDSNLQPLSEEITQNVTTMHKSFGWLAWKKTLGLKLGRSCPTVCPSTFRPWRCASPTNGGKDNGL